VGLGLPRYTAIIRFSDGDLIEATGVTVDADAEGETG
jgi:hypothetical protein